MAVYKIFAAADATLYSAYSEQNTGLDEILEVGCKNSRIPSAVVNSADDIRRAVVLFSDADIARAYALTSGSNTWDANLRLYFANAENLNTQYDLFVYPLSQSWDMGTGKFLDSPESKNGVSWKNSKQNTAWSNNTSYFITAGGGYFNTGSSVTVSQSFGYKDPKDINVSVKSTIANWTGSTIVNNGFIIKMSSSIEQNTGSYTNLNFFSVDTHTIYPPTLEFKWDDSVYITGSLSVVGGTNTIVTLDNNTGIFKNDTGKYLMKVNARDTYPPRQFIEYSVYTVNKALPRTSYWAIQDVKTEEMVIDFDTNYTKISCSPAGSFFTVYMNGLEPERYYKILIRMDLATGESVDIDGNNTFKIVR